MKLTLEIKNLKDLQILLPLLERLKIAVTNSSEDLPEEENEDDKKMTLGQLWGISPSLDANSFNQYLQQTRD